MALESRSWGCTREGLCSHKKLCVHVRSSVLQNGQSWGDSNVHRRMEAETSGVSLYKEMLRHNIAFPRFSQRMLTRHLNKSYLLDR